MIFRLFRANRDIKFTSNRIEESRIIIIFDQTMENILFFSLNLMACIKSSNVNLCYQSFISIALPHKYALKANASFKCKFDLR